MSADRAAADLGALTLADFEPAVGEPFVLPVGTFAGYDQPVTITLIAAKAGPIYPGQPPERRQPFGLIFRGEPHVSLEQGMYPFEHARLGLLTLFIVPIARTGDTLEYEAIFN